MLAVDHPNMISIRHDYLNDHKYAIMVLTSNRGSYGDPVKSWQQNQVDPLGRDYTYRVIGVYTDTKALLNT